MRLPAWPVFVLLFTSCGLKSSKEAAIYKDIHSYSNPQQVAIRHIDLDLAVLFDRQSLQGAAVLTLDRTSKSAPLILDTSQLQIDLAESSSDGKNFRETQFQLGKTDAILGASLTIQLPRDATHVRLRYSSSPSASGLQWLEPAQTAGKQHPFLYSQSQAIHARSWIPLQDSPGVRVTYTAHIKTPRGLRAIMSAEHDAADAGKGDYRFHMNERIPAYLIAIAAGDIDFQPTGPRTGVYAEPGVVHQAAKEFEDTEKMLEAAENLFGPYRWGRYDVLVLPPSFPFGGMENPRVTFATPTVLVGDKSLVSLVAHEMAHSWSGNLVTNATWSDFWLNEGFTVYIERRILEQVYGRAREEMEASLGRREVERELSTLPRRDQLLHIDLKGRDPDDGATQVPYEKGALFLRNLEEVFGRQRFDEYLKSYFEHFAFQSITTEQALDYLRRNLLDKDPALAAKVPVTQWVYEAGLPAAAPHPHSDAFTKVEAGAAQWLRGGTAETAGMAGWSTQEWLHFLRTLPEKLTVTQMQRLDQSFGFTRSANDEILDQWLLMALRTGYAAAYPRLEEFLVTVGRRKYIKPLYQEMVKTAEGKARAVAIYEKARPGYQAIARNTIDGIVGWTL